MSRVIAFSGRARSGYEPDLRTGAQRATRSSFHRTPDCTERADLALVDARMGTLDGVRKRQRIGFGASFKAVADQPGSTVSGDDGYASMLVGVWYWIAGVPVDDEESNDLPSEREDPDS